MGVVFMFKRNHVSVLAMLASFLFFTACSDDAVSNPAPVATESSAAESSSSEVFSNPGSSNHEALSSSLLSSSSEISSASKIVELARLSTCDAHNEGAVDSIWDGNAKYGFKIDYYKCKNGHWYEAEPSVACDSAGVSVGSLCNVHSAQGGYWGAGGRGGRCYEYVGTGTWNESKCLKAPAKECNAENEWSTGKITYSNGYTDFFQCEHVVYTDLSEELHDEGFLWQSVNEAYYNCSTGKNVEGDTCSFESQGEKQYYLFEGGQWVQFNIDPKLGMCRIYNDLPYELHFKEFEGEYYYCVDGKWNPIKLVPRQYTDPRKKGLTDEEYDVLDLPKEAKVGDRANGLLEYCGYGKTLDYFDSNVYDYCYSTNRYRYREDGSWTKETDEDLWEDDAYFGSKPCGDDTWCCAKTEGMKRNFFDYLEPGKTYQCVSGEIVLDEYLWNRFEKK
jgi:hypothetical protein